MKAIPLRHPQLLNPPSVCPQCGNKAWERTSPDDAEPEYQCHSCHWPSKTPRCGSGSIP